MLLLKAMFFSFRESTHRLGLLFLLQTGGKINCDVKKKMAESGKFKKRWEINYFDEKVRHEEKQQHRREENEISMWSVFLHVFFFFFLSSEMFLSIN